MKKEDKTVFLLSAYYICPEQDESKEHLSYLMPTYPEFRIREEHTGIYTTLKKAEAGIMCRIEELKEADNQWCSNENSEPINDLLYYDKEYAVTLMYYYGSLYCFWVDEIKLDTETLEVWTLPNATETRRSYLPDGTLWAENLTSETEHDRWYNIKETSREEMQCKGAFVGREPKEICFKEGDIVEVMRGVRVDLGIVCRVPDSIAEMQARKEHFTRLYPEKEGVVCYWEDFSDDIYLVLMGENVYKFKKGDDTEQLYDHNSYPVQVFPTRFPVSDGLTKSLHEAYLSLKFHPIQ